MARWKRKPCVAVAAHDGAPLVFPGGRLVRFDFCFLLWALPQCRRRSPNLALREMTKTGPVSVRTVFG